MAANQHMNGLFVVVEGADGSGKSAAVDRLVPLLRRDGYRVHRIDRARPDGPPEYANLIRAVDAIFRSAHDLGTNWHLLSLAAAAQYTTIIDGQVAPAVSDGAIVIAESWWNKTWIRLAVEAGIHLDLAPRHLTAFQSWQRALIPPPARAWEMTVVVNAPEKDRSGWYAANETKEPIYARDGRLSVDPAEFGRFTEQIALGLREAATHHQWPLVHNHHARTPDDVALEIRSFIDAARADSLTHP
jgi:hypothetical protein